MTPWLRGTERYDLLHLYPEHARRVGTLPGIMPGLLLERPASLPARLPLNLDGVHFDLRPGWERAVLTWRVRPAPEAPGGRQGASSPVSEVVLFRHWDPRALGSVLPLLDEFHYTRLLGPAEEVAVLDPVPLGGLGVRRAVRLPDLPVAPRGRLTLDAEQIAALDETMQERSRRRVAAYLRDVAPELTGSLSDAELHGRVRQCQATGTALGLASERAQMKWAYLMMLTDGRAAGTPQVLRFIRSGPSPDAQVDEAMRQVVAAARTHGEQT